MDMDIPVGRATIDRQWAELGNNVCGMLHGYRDASAIAAHFTGAGWTSRSSSWHGYELETTWCHLEIDPIEGPAVLLNGTIAPTHLDDLGRLLASFGLRYELELSDENNDLVREISPVRVDTGVPR
ncbi:hypothetical protein [Streptomyces sp. NPDC094032]|uniref:hypothetical protein n=1 Tax=Streptomyces sp. NPDC094032 TaxID=3155308 RepID=UPI00331ECF3D